MLRVSERHEPGIPGLMTWPEAFAQVGSMFASAAIVWAVAWTIVQLNKI